LPQKRTLEGKAITLKIILVLSLAITLGACNPKSPNQAASTDTAIYSVADTVPHADTNRPISATKASGYVPDPVGYVNDFTHLYTPGQSRILDSLVRDYEKRTGIEIAIVTVDSNMVGTQDFDSYTLGMANYWGIGKKKENNGILVAIAPYLRRIRIQNGLGIESKLSDKQTKTIIDSIFIPNFKKGDYYNGTKQGIIAITQQLKK
jgi:uncharacterized membrane protein YgcG